MKAKVQKWGNSLGLRIPKSLANEISLADGSEIEIYVEDDCIIIKSKQSKSKFRLKDLLKQFKPEHRSEESDLGKPSGKETW